MPKVPQDRDVRAARVLQIPKSRMLERVSTRDTISVGHQLGSIVVMFDW